MLTYVNIFSRGASKQPPSQQNRPLEGSLEIDQSQQEREMMMEESLEIDESQQGREMMMKESLEIDERQQGREMMMSVEESSISNYVPPDSQQNDAGDEFMEMDLYNKNINEVKILFINKEDDQKLICKNVSHETTIEDIIEELKVSEFFMLTNNKCYYIYQIMETRTIVLN